MENMPAGIVYSVHIVATAAWLSNEEGASDAGKCARAHEASEQIGEDINSKMLVSVTKYS